MNEPSFLASAVAAVLAAASVVLLTWATIRAVRSATASEAFAWMALAGLSYSLMGLAVAVPAPRSDGLRACALQLLSVLLAAALGGLSLGGKASGTSADEQEPRAAPTSLPSVGLLLAWLSLIGLPPALGFHGRVLVCRSLLAAGWTWLLALALAGSAAALVPGLAALALGCPGRARGVRAYVIALLVAAVVVLGAYPRPVLALVALLGDLAQI